MRTLPRLILISLVLTFAISCDQATKSIATQSLKGSTPVSLWGDSVRFQYTENTGAVFGIGSKLSPVIRIWLFTAAIGLFLAGLLVYVASARRLSGLNILALSLVLGGGLGNLLDRILNDGAVVDFVTVGVGRFRTAIFNFADLLVFVGIGLILWQSYRSKSTGQAPSNMPMKWTA